MFKTSTLALAMALSLLAGAVHAEGMTVHTFLTTAAGIPQNATAMLRPDTRRLLGEFRGAVRAVRAEQATARRAGRPPATCMPERVSLSPAAIMTRFNAIPAARRRTITVTAAFREWMAEQYPCPGS